MRGQHYLSLCLSAVYGLEIKRLDLQKEFGPDVLGIGKVVPTQNAIERKTLSVLEVVGDLTSRSRSASELAATTNDFRAGSLSAGFADLDSDEAVVMTWRPEGCGSSPANPTLNDAINSLNENAAVMKCEGWARYSTSAECQKPNFRAINNCTGIAFATAQPSFLMSHILLSVPKDNSAAVDLESMKKCASTMKMKRVDGASGCYIQCTDDPAPATFEDIALIMSEDDLMIYANYTFTKAHALAPAAYFLKAENATLCSAKLSFQISGHAFARKGSSSSGVLMNRFFCFWLAALAVGIV